MYIEFLIEDISSEKLLNFLVPKIAPQLTNPGNSYTFHPHGGINRLLTKLPIRLQSFAKTYSYTNDAYIFIICDLDNRNKVTFLDELNNILTSCSPKPNTAFCLAIEEMEAWLLGDITAIKKSYRLLNELYLRKYKQDSICGTWELLADIIYKGGAAALGNPGTEKCTWVEKIAPHMDIDANQSPSFQYFRDKLRGVVNACTV